MLYCCCVTSTSSMNTVKLPVSSLSDANAAEEGEH